MGRWAQRRRGGGGGGSGTDLIHIVSVNRDSDEILIVQYTGPITAADFSASDFTTSPGMLNPDTVDPDSSATIDLTFLVTTVGQFSVTYTGTVGGILTPQTVAIT